MTEPMVTMLKPTIYKKIEQKGRTYRIAHPRIDAYVPGAPGTYPTKPQVTTNSRALFRVVGIVLSILVRTQHKFERIDERT